LPQDFASTKQTAAKSTVRMPCVLPRWVRLELSNYHCCYPYVILTSRRWCCESKDASHAQEPPWGTAWFYRAEILFSQDV